MSETVRHAKEIFLDALNHEEGDARDKFLDEACGQIPELRRKVERLIATHELPDSILDRTEPLPGDQSLQPVGEMIGPYKILQTIGEGGMGAVFMAEQKEPVRRRVALKLIKHGMDTKQVMARFEAERQALAMMDHPNIAKVLDAGETDTGRPYFVMELVKGVPVTEYCDEHRLPTRERLSLFVDVCQAIQHAHQKGIIHRDLKPSNVLVAKFDDNPVIKVIDFGVAKATNQELTQQTMFTEFGQVIGTVEYMSPEQAQFNQLDVDTRSDIYSLGVLLYELLTGEPPFDRRRLRTAALDEVMRIIREEEPPKPSTRISTTGKDASTLSSKRSTDPSGLGRVIRGDVDLIVMKALEKDRGRRYETANGFAADIRRYLAGEAIEARPPSTSYRLRKLVSRNRGLFGAVAAVLLALSVGMTVALFQMKRAHENALAAMDLKKQADEAAQKARESEESLRRAVESQRVMIQEQTLLAILRGDYSELDELDSVMEAFDLSPEWVVVMKGFTDIMKGDSSAAISELAMGSEGRQQDLSRLALSAIARGEIGDEDKRFQQMALLRTLEPKSFEEHLLMGLGLYRWLPEDGMKHLQIAHKMRPYSPVVRLLLEDSRCHLAANMADHGSALELTRQACENTDALALLMNDDPQFLAISIQARLQHAHLLALTGDQEQSLILMNSLVDDAEKLTQSADHDSAAWWPFMVDLMRGENERAFNSFEARSDAGLRTNNYIAAYLAAICFQEDALDEGIALLGQTTQPFKDDVAGTNLYFQLARPNAQSRREEVLRQLQARLATKQANSSSKFFLFVDWTVAKMLGEESVAARIGQTLYESAVKRNLFPEEIACGDFMRGNQTDASLLLEQCSDFQLFLGYAHWVIGFDRLAKGQRSEAESHFAKIGQTSDFQHGIFWWGKAFHARAADETWLPWF